MDRRSFIKNSCSSCLSAAAIPVFLSSCASLRNSTGKMVKDGIMVSLEDFKLKENGNSAYRSFLVVNNEGLKYPICIYRFNEQEYTALWMQCSHQGAELRASGDYLQCPAHGSEFNNRGSVTSGPATNPLKTFPVAITGNELFIDLRKQS